MSDNKAIVYCENLVKLYKIGDIEVMALQGLDLQVEEGGNACYYWKQW